jgi:hypothetical protein
MQSMASKGVNRWSVLGATLFMALAVVSVLLYQPFKRGETISGFLYELVCIIAALVLTPVTTTVTAVFLCNNDSVTVLESMHCHSPTHWAGALLVSVLLVTFAAVSVRLQAVDVFYATRNRPDVVATATLTKTARDAALRNRLDSLRRLPRTVWWLFFEFVPNTTGRYHPVNTRHLTYHVVGSLMTATLAATNTLAKQLSLAPPYDRLLVPTVYFACSLMRFLASLRQAYQDPIADAVNISICFFVFEIAALAFGRSYNDLTIPLWWFVCAMVIFAIAAGIVGSFMHASLYAGGEEDNSCLPDRASCARICGMMCIRRRKADPEWQRPKSSRPDQDLADVGEEEKKLGVMAASASAARHLDEIAFRDGLEMAARPASGSRAAAPLASPGSRQQQQQQQQQPPPPPGLPSYAMPGAQSGAKPPPPDGRSPFDVAPAFSGAGREAAPPSAPMPPYSRSPSAAREPQVPADGRSRASSATTASRRVSLNLGEPAVQEEPELTPRLKEHDGPAMAAAPLWSPAPGTSASGNVADESSPGAAASANASFGSGSLHARTSPLRGAAAASSSAIQLLAHSDLDPVKEDDEKAHSAGPPAAQSSSSAWGMPWCGQTPPWVACRR